MKKVINWKSIEKESIKSDSPTSGRAYLEEAKKSLKQQVESQETLAKAIPLCETLLRTRLLNKTPILIKKSFQYVTSDLVTDYSQKWDDSEGGWVADLSDPTGAHLQDHTHLIPVGTELVLKSIDMNLFEFIFKSNIEGQEEITLPFTTKHNLMFSSNIIETVDDYLQGVKEDE
jgi:hypothetical protein